MPQKTPARRMSPREFRPHLSSDESVTVHQIDDGLVLAAVAKGQLVASAPGGEAEQLVAEADAKDGLVLPVRSANHSFQLLDKGPAWGRGQDTSQVAPCNVVSARWGGGPRYDAHHETAFGPRFPDT